MAILVATLSRNGSVEPQLSFTPDLFELPGCYSVVWCWSCICSWIATRLNYSSVRTSQRWTEDCVEFKGYK